MNVNKMKKSRWDVSYIPSQAGRVAIVTGANSGLGYETAKALSMAGATVLMACRNQEKGKKAKEQIERELDWSNISLLRLDLADLESVREFAQQVSDQEEKIDILVNNAGLMAIPYQLTMDGFEMQFGVNHLGHFALTGLLYPMLKSAEAARIVNVSSIAHRIGKINFDDLQSRNAYNKWKAYGQSKLANLLFTHELNNRFQAKGENIMALAAHPGYAATELPFKGPEMEKKLWKNSIMNAGNILAGQPASRGALPSLYAATAQEAERGGFYGPGGLLGIHGYPSEARAKNGLVNDRDSALLWKRSEELTGVHWLSVDE